MEKKFQKRRTTAFFLLFTILAISCLSVVYANLPITEFEEEKLPPFLLKLSERFAEGNATKLTLIRKQMIEQLKRNQEMMPVEGNVSKNPPSSGSRTTYYYIDDVYDIWEYHGGDVDYEDNIIGSQDGSYAHIHTDEADAEAWIIGDMGSSSCTGCIMLYGVKGPHSSTGWSNCVWACVSNDTEAEYDDWDFIGWGNMTYSVPLYYYLGNYEGTFSAVIVGCFSGYDWEDNCINVDTFYAAG